MHLLYSVICVIMIIECITTDLTCHAYNFSLCTVHGDSAMAFGVYHMHIQRTSFDGIDFKFKGAECISSAQGEKNIP